MFFSFIFLPSTICRGLNSDVTIFRDSVFWRHIRGISFYNNRAISINREWFVRESRPWNDVGMARFKKGNNFPLSTPTVRRKGVKMLRTQVEPRAANKCGFTQVWRVWLIVAGRGSRGAGPQSRSRVQCRGRGKWFGVRGNWVKTSDMKKI